MLAWFRRLFRKHGDGVSGFAPLPFDCADKSGNASRLHLQSWVSDGGSVVGTSLQHNRQLTYPFDRFTKFRDLSYHQISGYSPPRGITPLSATLAMKAKVWAAFLAFAALLGCYDALSSQLGLQSIAGLWGASKSLLPIWGWVSLAEAVAIGMLYRKIYTHTPVQQDAPIDLSLDINKLERRLKSAQDHITNLLSWKDRNNNVIDLVPEIKTRVDIITNEFSAVSKIVENLSLETKHLNEMDKVNDSAIKKLDIAVIRLKARTRANVYASMVIDEKAAMAAIAKRMDEIDYQVYGKGFNSNLDTDFVPYSHSVVEFDALAEVACDIVAAIPGMSLLLDIPNGAGRSLFIPKDEGYLVNADIGERRERGYAAAQRRYIHFQIWEYVIKGRGQ